MTDDVRARMKESTEDFLNLVWPVFQSRFGRLAPVELVSANAFARELDVRAGIDHWILRKDGHLSGLASRVQWHEKGYNSFTIRVRSKNGRPTEYDKRLRELESRGKLVGPWYVCQAYVSLDHTKLVAAAIARMGDVVAAVEQKMGRLLPPNGDGSQGFAVWWRDLQQSGAPIHIWDAATHGKRTA